MKNKNMPGFSENPQQNKSGEKSEKPKKLDDGTIRGVLDNMNCLIRALGLV